MLKLLTLAVIVGVAAASCPNKCSGHGQCSTNDKCACYSNYQGSDCSMRTCPFGLAWADIPTGSTAHDYAECSNRGTCERSSGECECFEGFSGAACGRTTCPQDCSGHGTCESIEELAGTKYAGWDAGKSRGCKCDGGYSGVDCATRMCPKGDDPLTTEVDVTQASTTSLQVNEVQNVTVQAVSQPINSGNVTFTFTDLYNSVWTTRPVLLPPAKAYLNNQALLTGTCAASGGSASICRLVGAPTGDANDVINGLNIDVTTGATVEHRVISDYVKTNKVTSVAPALVGGDPSGAGVYAVRGGLKTNAANWKKVASRTIFIDATLAADGTYTGTLDAAITGATIRTVFRKGDYLMVGNPLLGADDYKTSTCLMQLAADYVADATTLSFVADDASTPCVQGATGTKTTLYGLWDDFKAVAIAYDGAAKKATAYDAVTGALTVDATGAAGTLQRNLVPGMWIRLYHNNEPAKAYCDMQVNSFDNRAGQAGNLMNAQATTVYVNPASATATTLGGSNLCNDWSYAVNDRGTAKYLGATSNVGFAIIHSSLVSEGQRAGTAVGTKMGSTVAVASADGVATITSAVTLAADVAFMGPGTLLYLMNDDEGAAVSAFYCACVISVRQTTGTSGVVKCVAPPTIAGVAPTSCTTKTRAAANDIRYRLFGQNSLHFHEVDSNNPNRFQYHQVGDTFRVSNVDSTSTAVGTATSGRPTSSAEYEVSHMDPATASSAIFFKFGSKPNGGGMYPVLNVLQTLTADWTAIAAIPVTLTVSPWLRSTIVIQPSRSGKAWAATSSADTWALSDVATVNSARDVKRVLEELPNQVIDSVDVAMTSNTVGLYAYSVTFTGGRNSGNQNEIAMNAAGCNTDGCQPRYTGVAIQRATFFDDLVIEAGKVTVGATPGAETALLNDAGYFSPRGSETMLFYQAGAMNGQTAPNMYATKTGTADPAGVIAEASTAVITDGTTTPVTESPTSVMILRNKGAHSDTDKSVYFKAGTYEITRGTKESLECAGRGSCEEGLCACYEGYTGEACATMTVLT